MYNRYVPQADGSFHRSRVEDRIPEKKPNPPELPHIPTPPPEQFLPKQESIPCPNPRLRPPRSPNHSPGRTKKFEQTNSSIPSFIKQLIPKDFDTSDLMIVLLLLIMSGDCVEDQNTALLTLVLYLFM